MKRLTLQSRITRLTIRSLFLVGSIILCAAIGYAYTKYSISRSAYVDSLRASTAHQVQLILPALLVEEQIGGLALQLEKIKVEESLHEIHFISNDKSDSLKNLYPNCKFSNILTECYVDDKIILAIPLTIAENSYGYLLKIKKIPTFSIQGQHLYAVEIILLILFLIFTVQFLALSKLTSKEVPSSLNALLNWINSEVSSSDRKISKPSLKFDELNELAEKISVLIKENEQQRIQARIGLMAAQVSHDIRSPLAALSLVMTDLAQIPEEKRIIIRSAVNRINDIANDLLRMRNSSSQVETANENFDQIEFEKIEIALVTPIVDSIVSEKRIQIRAKQSIEIISDFSRGYGVFLKIDTVALKRVLSNIIQNSIEAFDGKSGKIFISVETSGNRFSIKIEDDGKGIPKEVIEKLGSERISFGKKNSQSGSGLGIYHAKHVVEFFGGNFCISSSQGIGTTVRLDFAREKSPNWFVERILVEDTTTIVSVDDDISIHQLWKRRLSDIEISKAKINHITYTSCSEFMEYVQSASKELTYSKNFKKIYLIDYEFLNQSSTGLEVIEQLGIGKHSILVTSHYDDESLINRCLQLGVKLIPKVMAGFVEIHISPKISKYVLIDDDVLVHSIWNLEAKRENKQFQGFYSFEEFKNKIFSISLDAIIYIDSNLGVGVRGEEVAKQIRDMGYENIYLSTGYEQSHFDNMPWIKKVVGKSPFLN